MNNRQLAGMYIIDSYTWKNTMTQGENKKILSLAERQGNVLTFALCKPAHKTIRSPKYIK